MNGNFRKQLEGFFFWDTAGSGANPIPPYQIVSLATTTECDAAIATGKVPSGVGYGDIVVRTPVSGGVASRRIVGVTDGAGWSLGQSSADAIPVVVSGVALVQFSAAVNFDPNALLTCGLVETRTNAQTPFTNNLDMLIPVDPRFGMTYQLALAAQLSITPASSGANVAYYPLGFMLEDATAKYDILPVELSGCPKVLYA